MKILKIHKFFLCILCVFVMLLTLACSWKSANSKIYTMKKDVGKIEVVLVYKENEKIINIGCSF